MLKLSEQYLTEAADVENFCWLPGMRLGAR